jgi:mannose-6-phosphate isomerase-like protein (cupin superfamily)
MKIIHKKDALHFTNPEGTKVDLYLRSEYSVYYNEILPHATQTWHHHDHILESHFIIEGELTVKWREGEKEVEEIVSAGDLTEAENTPHTFTNHTDQVVRFLVIKQVPSGQDKAELLKTDKVLD